MNGLKLINDTKSLDYTYEVKYELKKIKIT